MEPVWGLFLLGFLHPESLCLSMSYYVCQCLLMPVHVCICLSISVHVCNFLCLTMSGFVIGICPCLPMSIYAYPCPSKSLVPIGGVMPFCIVHSRAHLLLLLQLLPPMLIPMSLVWKPLFFLYNILVFCDLTWFQAHTIYCHCLRLCQADPGGSSAENPRNTKWPRHCLLLYLEEPEES